MQSALHGYSHRSLQLALNHTFGKSFLVDTPFLRIVTLMRCFLRIAGFLATLFATTFFLGISSGQEPVPPSGVCKCDAQADFEQESGQTCGPTTKPAICVSCKNGDCQTNQHCTFHVECVTVYGVCDEGVVSFEGRLGSKRPGPRWEFNSSFFPNHGYVNDCSISITGTLQLDFQVAVEGKKSGMAIVKLICKKCG